MALIVGTALVCGALAARQIATLTNGQFPGYRTLDHILTPTPTDPLCWDALIVAILGDRYTVRHATVSLAPKLVSAAACPEFTVPPRTNPPQDPRGAPLTQPPAPPRSLVHVPESASIQWLGEYSMSRGQLVQLVREHCDAAGLMQFARAPFGFRYGESWLLGDLRFGRGAGFQIEVAGGRPATCSIRVPWVPPRADLLSPQTP
jgi:hypothetical protein